MLLDNKFSEFVTLYVHSAGWVNTPDSWHVRITQEAPTSPMTIRSGEREVPANNRLIRLKIRRSTRTLVEAAVMRTAISKDGESLSVEGPQKRLEAVAVGWPIDGRIPTVQVGRRVPADW